MCHSEAAIGSSSSSRLAVLPARPHMCLLKCVRVCIVKSSVHKLFVLSRESNVLIIYVIAVPLSNVHFSKRQMLLNMLNVSNFARIAADKV